jgi:hypothetical protein
MLLPRTAFLLLAGFPEISAAITLKKPYGLFCTKVATKKMIGAYELIVVGLHKVPYDRQRLININLKSLYTDLYSTYFKRHVKL